MKKYSRLLINTLIYSMALVQSNNVWAAMSLDRTRVIYDAASKSVSMSIRNDSKELPYLAQAWLEDASMNKISGPLVVIPPLQRVEPSASSQVRISVTDAVSSLPQDRESLFYFNLREIPPRSDKPNTMQIALQTKIKVFYRPSGITASNDNKWVNQLVLRKTERGMVIENPTPYFITITNLTLTTPSAKDTAFSPIMLEPKSVVPLAVAIPAQLKPSLTFINDYGGHQTLTFTCDLTTCHTHE